MGMWHKISKSRVRPNEFVAVIEIPKGSKTKYEIDSEVGMIILDRVLYTSTLSIKLWVYSTHSCIG